MRINLKCLGTYFKKYTHDLYSKMFIIIFFTGLIDIISLSMAIFLIGGKYIREDIDNKLKNQTQQISNIMDSYINEMKKNLIVLAADEKISELINGNFTKDESYNVYKESYKLLNTLSIANPRNQFYIFCYRNNELLTSDSMNTTEDYSRYQIEKFKWYNSIINSKTDFVLLDEYIPPIKQRGETFALALRIKPYYQYSSLGFIVVSTGKSYLSELLKGTSYTTMDFLLITNPEGEIVYTSNKEQVNANRLDREHILNILKGKGNAYQGSSGKKYIVNINISPKTGWYIICFSDEKALIRNISSMNIVVIIITSFCIGLLIFFSYFISSRFTKPIKQLVKLMHKAEAEGYRVASDIKRNDEIGDLSEEFNVMIRKVLENQVLRREAEIDALQQQINPHFLYNTLDSIKSLSAIHGDSDVHSIAEKLGDMFRYSINHEKSKVIGIKEEMQHVKNYIAIQKIRYGDRFDIVYNVDKEVYNYKTLKFILQPIVENAIYHGIEQINKNGLITIKGYFEERSIVFEVIDNGSGMQVDELDQLNDYISGKLKNISYKKTQSIGLRNIQERIQLFYGESYGIKIYGRKGVGARVVLKIPVRENGETYNV